MVEQNRRVLTKTTPYYTIESEKEEKCNDTITEKEIEKEVEEVLERMGHHKRRNGNRFCNALCVVNSIPYQIHCFIYYGNLGIDKQNLV